MLTTYCESFTGKICYKEIPCCELPNGLKIGNYSSGHSFDFYLGKDQLLWKLNACTEKRNKETELEPIITVIPSEETRFTTITIDFELTPFIEEEVQQIWHEDYKDGALWYDVIIVPLPLMQAMKKVYWHIEDSPFRVVRVHDRYTKQIRSDIFCV